MDSQTNKTQNKLQSLSNSKQPIIGQNNQNQKDFQYSKNDQETDRNQKSSNQLFIKDNDHNQDVKFSFNDPNKEDQNQLQFGNKNEQNNVIIKMQQQAQADEPTSPQFSNLFNISQKQNQNQLYSQNENQQQDINQNSKIQESFGNEENRQEQIQNNILNKLTQQQYSIYKINSPQAKIQEQQNTEGKQSERNPILTTINDDEDYINDNKFNKLSYALQSKKQGQQSKIKKPWKLVQRQNQSHKTTKNKSLITFNTTSTTINFKNICQHCQKNINKEQERFQKCINCDQLSHKDCIIKSHIKETNFQMEKWKCQSCFHNQWQDLVNKYSTLKNWFMYRIRVLIVRTQYFQLDKRQRSLIDSLINDKSYIAVQNIHEICSYYFLKHLPVYSPSSHTVNIWNSILYGAISFKIFEVPLVISFDLYNETSLVYEIPIFIILVLEILFSFQIGFYSEGVIVYDKKKIRNQYIHGKMILDLFVLFGVFLSIVNNNTLYAIPIIFKVVQVQYIIYVFEEQLQVKRIFYTLLEIIKLMNLVFFVAHFLACGFHLTAVLEQKSSPGAQTWLIANEYDNLSTAERYIHSLYFSFISMSTIGYGDISPVTSTERIFIIISTLISCGIFAYSLNIVTSIFQEKATVMAAFRKKKSEILSYMLHREIDSNLQIKVIKNLEHKFKMDQEGLTKSNTILNSLDNQLKNEIKKDFYLGVLKNHIIFKANFSDLFLAELSLQMEELTLAPDEVLFYQKEQASKLYFIFKGEISLFTVNNKDEDEEIHLGSIGQGKIVGTKTFFTNYTRPNSAKSLKTSQLIYLNREVFLETIKKYPIDQERYLELKDSLKIEQDHSLGHSYEMCVFCQKQGHNIANCPFLHLHVDKRWNLHKKIKRERKMINQQRYQLPLQYKYYERPQIQPKRRIKKIKTFLDLSKHNEYNFSQARIDCIEIRKKYVLEHTENLEAYNQKSNFLPLDFYTTIQYYISEVLDPLILEDEEILTIMPGIVISHKLETKKMDSQQYIGLKQGRQQFYNIIPDFDYNFQKDHTLALQNYCDIYTTAKQLEIKLKDIKNQSNLQEEMLNNMEQENNYSDTKKNNNVIKTNFNQNQQKNNDDRYNTKKITSDNNIQYKIGLYDFDNDNNEQNLCNSIDIKESEYNKQQILLDAQQQTYKNNLNSSYISNSTFNDQENDVFDSIDNRLFFKNQQKQKLQKRIGVSQIKNQSSKDEQKFYQQINVQKHFDRNMTHRLSSKYKMSNFTDNNVNNTLNPNKNDIVFNSSNQLQIPNNSNVNQFPQNASILQYSPMKQQNNMTGIQSNNQLENAPNFSNYINLGYGNFQEQQKNSMYSQNVQSQYNIYSDNDTFWLQFDVAKDYIKYFNNYNQNKVIERYELWRISYLQEANILQVLIKNNQGTLQSQDSTINNLNTTLNQQILLDATLKQQQNQRKRISIFDSNINAKIKFQPHQSGRKFSFPTMFSQSKNLTLPNKNGNIQDNDVIIVDQGNEEQQSSNSQSNNESIENNNNKKQ